MSKETGLTSPIENIKTDCMAYSLLTIRGPILAEKLGYPTDYGLDFMVKAVDGFKPGAKPEAAANARELISWLLPESQMPPALLILLSSERVASQPKKMLRFGRNPIIPLLFCYEKFPAKSLRLMNRTVTMEPSLASIQEKTPAARLYRSTAEEYEMAYAFDIAPDHSEVFRQWAIQKRAPDIYDPDLVHSTKSSPDPDYLPLGTEQLIERYHRTVQAQNLKAVEKHRLAKTGF